jgi:ribonuclease HI
LSRFLLAKNLLGWSPSLSRLIRKSDPPQVIKALTLAKIASFDSSIKIYTDGSKDQTGKVSSAFCIPKFNIACKQRLSDNLSVYTAELMAIKFAIEWVIVEQSGSLQSDDRRIIIFSDSLSSLQSLNSRRSLSRPNIVNNICGLKVNRNVSIVWIPGHSDINGNDCADRLAREAICHPLVDISISCEASEAQEAIDRYILQRWQTLWNSSATGQFNRSVVSVVSCDSKYNDNVRARERMISRLRLGKCLLNHYLFRIKSHPTGLCSTCSVPETIEHCLLNCVNTNIVNLLRAECAKQAVGMDIRTILSCKHLTNCIYTAFTNLKRSI